MIIIDAVRYPGVIAAANYMATSLALGDRVGGGARHRAASATSQAAGGCYVIKASEDATRLPPPPNAAFHVFCDAPKSVKAPISAELNKVAEAVMEQAKNQEPREPVSAVETPGAEVDLKLTSADGSLPSHVSEEARAAAIELSTKLARFGLSPGHKRHGFTLVFGDSKELLRRHANGACVYGECAQPDFDYAAKGQEKDILTPEGFAQVKVGGEQNGAMVIDSQTLMLAAANFFVTDIGKGDRSGGGGRHRMASAVSQQANGCFVVKASEGACGTAANPPAATATFDVFCNRKIPEKVLIMEGVEGGAAAEEPPTPPVEGSLGEVERLRAALAAEHAQHEEEMAAAQAELAELRLAKADSAAGASSSPKKKRWFSLGPVKGKR